MSDDPEAVLLSLHQLYCSLTGRALTYQFYQRDWSEFVKFFNADDLKFVLAWVERENGKRDKPFQIRTDLLRIIGDLAVFDSLKAEAELETKARAARARAFKPTAGQSALAAMRCEEVQPPERGPVVARDVLLKNLSDLKTKLEQQ